MHRLAAHVFALTVAAGVFLLFFDAGAAVIVLAVAGVMFCALVIGAFVAGVVRAVRVERRHGK